MSSFKDHCLDDKKLKEGVKLPLFDKDGGISDDYLMVRWSWDDKVRAALDKLKREGTKSIIQVTPEMNKKQKASVEGQNKRITDKLVADGLITQIASWSFEESLTKTNLLAFIKARPDIADRVDTLAANTKLFFTNSGASS